ncbi:MAG: hypothetical protein KTM48_02510, partial [Wolbachia endosymbiont of Pissodes strobi]|nr:hypothetical protein [Wolbachia endosymbiont of Pissodes strobi]
RNGNFYAETQKYGYPPILINNTPIPPKLKLKYLGIMLDKRLTFGEHVTHIKNKNRIISDKLRPLIRHGSFLSPANKITLYRSITRPFLMHGAPVWCSISDTQMNKIQVIQNRLREL